MTETTPDPADVHTGTDRVELTDAERASLNCDCVKYDGSHYDTCFVPAVGSIVAVRLQALTAERDELRRECDNRVMEAVQEHAAESLKRQEALRAELAAANTELDRLAALKGRVDELAEYAERAQVSEATLDRVVALADEWEAEAAKATRPVRKMGAGSRADKFIQGHATNLARQAKRLRAALTPEGTE